MFRDITRVTSYSNTHVLNATRRDTIPFFGCCPKPHFLYSTNPRTYSDRYHPEYVAGPLTYHLNISILYTAHKIHSVSSIRTNSTLFFLLLSFAKNIQQRIIKAVVNYLVSTDNVFRPVPCYFCSRRHCLNCSASSVGRLIKIKQDLIRPVSLGEKQRSTRSR